MNYSNDYVSTYVSLNLSLGKPIQNPTTQAQTIDICNFFTTLCFEVSNNSLIKENKGRHEDTKKDRYISSMGYVWSIFINPHLSLVYEENHFERQLTSEYMCSCVNISNLVSSVVNCWVCKGNDEFYYLQSSMC